MLHPIPLMSEMVSIISLLDTSNFSSNSPDLLAAVKESPNQPVGYATLQLLNLVLDSLTLQLFSKHIRLK